jgi:hypothetical protein
MAGETFEHDGVAFRIIKQAPEPQDIVAGDWLRIIYNPYDGKPDRVGEVISCRRFWPIMGDGHLGDDYRVDIALNGNADEPYWFLHSEEYCEIVLPLSRHCPGRASRNIVVCFDGTRNQNETQNTNVHRLYELLDKRSTICSYYSGVGVGGRIIGNLLDSASGRGLFRTVRAAYTFVRGNYILGDKIFVFGFSRGAYAARHLAGMIARIGIKHHTEVGYDEYRRSLAGDTQHTRKGADHTVHFLGMFDCVPGNQLYTLGRVGSGVNNRILEPDILCMAHSVSTDERRWSFRPLIFSKTDQRQFNQAWFPGYHFDVGGDNNKPLNNFALAWMLVAAAESGLLTAQLADFDFDPTARGLPSDWPLTKLGLNCSRKSLPDTHLISPQPDYYNLRMQLDDLRARMASARIIRG